MTPSQQRKGRTTRCGHAQAAAVVNHHAAALGFVE
jgi:hypothetical protein